MTKTLTEGNPAKLILFFSLPLIIGNIFQQFYSMADTLIVGRTLGVNALAAVGCTGSITFLILGFVQGLTAGLSIITSQKFGAHNEEAVKKKLCSQYPYKLRCGQYHNDFIGTINTTFVRTTTDTCRNY